MALTKCADCGHDVSTEAAACPNCGRPRSAAPSVAATAESSPPPSSSAAAQTPPAIWPPPQPVSGTQPTTPKKPNWFARHKILTVVLGLLLLIILAAAAAGSSRKNANGSTSPPPRGSAHTRTNTTPTHPPKSKPKPKPTPSLTGPQQQAVESAQNYLSEGQGFSRAGLIQQLSSSYGDGFPKVVAVFAVDYLNVNWRQQAIASARNYLSEGQGFSRAGLIQQLSSSSGDGFLTSEADFAVDHLNVNWDQQAAEAAKSYKETGGGFSCSGMIQQLSSSYGSGFTYAQAQYGAKRAGVC